MENLGDNTIPHTGSVLVGTVDGSIKLITQIQQVSFQLFLRTWLASVPSSSGPFIFLYSIKFTKKIPQVLIKLFRN
jgi:hypothetical protein